MAHYKDGPHAAAAAAAHAAAAARSAAAAAAILAGVPRKSFDIEAALPDDSSDSDSSGFSVVSSSLTVAVKSMYFFELVFSILVGGPLYPLYHYMERLNATDRTKGVVFGSYGCGGSLLSFIFALTLLGQSKKGKSAYLARALLSVLCIGGVLSMWYVMPHTVAFNSSAADLVALVMLLHFMAWNSTCCSPKDNDDTI